MNEFLDDDIHVYIPDTPLLRVSRDTRCNSHGIKLLDVCKSICLRIVNGTLGRDHNIGEYTFVSNQGASVIDYLLTRECNFPHITDFYIEPLNEWSDHSPISFSLSCNNRCSHAPVEQEEIKIIWDSKYKNNFRAGLIGKPPAFNLLTSDINISSKESINKVLTDFANIVRSVTDPLFSTHVSQKEKIYFNDSSYASSAEWFDLECSQAKQRYLEALRVFQNLDTNLNREHLCASECKLAYKKIICKKKKSFESKKLTEIENLRHGKPKQFWTYFKRKHDQKYDISADEFFNYFFRL